MSTRASCVRAIFVFVGRIRATTDSAERIARTWPRANNPARPVVVPRGSATTGFVAGIAESQHDPHRHSAQCTLRPAARRLTLFPQMGGHTERCVSARGGPPAQSEGLGSNDAH